MGKEKGKKMKTEEQKPDEEKEQVIEVEIDEAVLLSLQKLGELQDELDKVNEKAVEEVTEIEQKYSEIRKPVYAKREEFIQRIPDFWTISFASHPFIFDRLTPEDQKVFKYLSSIEVEDFEVASDGYTITFNFKPNPYFENSKLSKSFSSPEDTLTVTGTTINWKEGMDLTTEAKNEKKGSKKRPFVDDRSFFCWFNDTELTDEAEEFSDEVAEIISEELWPNPLQYYNYEPEEATDNDLELDDDDDNNKDGEEQDEDEDDDDEDDDDDGDSE